MLFVILFILVLVAVFVAAKLFRTKKSSNGGRSNRYRAYNGKESTNSSDLPPNRYHRQKSHEPAFAKKHILELEAEPARKPVEPTQKMEQRAPTLSDDPDIVLGLKKEKKVSKKEESLDPESAGPVQMTLQPSSLPSPLITFHVMASTDKPYTGYELLQAILSVGMRYGRHQIFHRHEEKTGKGEVLFSLASVMRPGSFDLPKMGGFTTSGLSLFFQANQVEEPLEVYELMLRTAGQLVEDLGGQVLDGKREPLTPATVVQHRKDLREYEGSKQATDLFDTLEE